MTTELLPDEATSLLSNDAGKSNATARLRSNRHYLDDKGPISILLKTFYGCCVVFGLYAAIFYSRTAIISNACGAWELNFPGLYQPSLPAANWSLVAHILAGSFLYLVSPLQYVKSIRRNCMPFHRWLGRITFVVALVCAWGALFKLALVGSPMGIHATLGNGILAILLLVATVQTYYHAAFTKDIERHERWAWRFGAILSAALMARVILVGLMVLSKPGSTDPEELGPLLLFVLYLPWLPSLVFVEWYWRKSRGAECNDIKTLDTSEQDRSASTTSPSPLVKRMTIWASVAFLLVATFLNFMGAWWPAMTADLSKYAVSER